jgi:hypothetical protein
MHLPYEEAHARNKLGNSQIVWNTELLGGGKDKSKYHSAIGGGQVVTRADKRVAG